MIQFLNNKIFWSLGFLLLFASACDPDEDKEDSKLIQFEYFEENSAIERYIQWSIDAVYVTLPSCFIQENYYNFSITNDQNFVCSETQSFFSIDRIPEEDMDEYRTFFEVEKNENSFSNEEVILDYIKDTRLSNLVGSSYSTQTSIETFKQKEIMLVSVKGRSGKYDNDLFYQFGAITFDDATYLIQFIVNEEDVYYYHKDIMTIFKSIRHA